MRPEENIEKIIKKFDIDINTRKDQQIFDELRQAQAISKQSKPGISTIGIWSMIIKNKIPHFSAAVGVVLVVCWLMLTLSNKQQGTNVPTVVVISKTPAELVSVISLSTVFRDGDLRSVERQFDKAEKKVKSGLIERITIDQLICELNECEEI